MAAALAGVTTHPIKTPQTLNVHRSAASGFLDVQNWRFSGIVGGRAYHRRAYR
jgi:hypothetical protein